MQGNEKERISPKDAFPKTHKDTAGYFSERRRDKKPSTKFRSGDKGVMLLSLSSR